MSLKEASFLSTRCSQRLAESLLQRTMRAPVISIARFRRSAAARCQNLIDSCNLASMRSVSQLCVVRLLDVCVCWERPSQLRQYSNNKLDEPGCNVRTHGFYPLTATATRVSSYAGTYKQPRIHARRYSQRAAGCWPRLPSRTAQTARLTA